MLGERAQLERARVQGPGEALGALDRTVGAGDARLRLRGEMRGDELDHLARADEEDALVLEAWVNARRQLDGGGGHRDARRADARGGTDLLRHCERALEQAMQQASQRARRFRGARRLLHLAEDLRLADDHRVEAGGDAERMAHGLLVRQRIQVLLQFLGTEPVILRQPLRELVGALPRDIELGAVAGRQDRRFVRQAALQLPQRLVQALDMKHHALAHGERRGLMVQSEGEQQCGQAADYKRVSTFSAGSGGLKRKPCTWSQRNRRSSCACCSVSTPSATTLRRSACASEMMVVMIAVVSGGAVMACAEVRSSFSGCSARLARW